MKNSIKLILIICFSLFILQSAKAQVPQAIPYQAVARNNAGTLIANHNISLRISIHDSSPAGTVVYKETLVSVTNTLGLFTVNIGQGTPVTGSFNGINWGSGAKFLQVELDTAGGSSYVNMGTQQMMSVAYALYSGKTDALLPGTVSGNTLRWNGISWTEDNLITNTGTNVGIGTTSPFYKLDVNGDASVNGIRVGKGNGSLVYNTVLGTEALKVTTSGDLNTAIGYRSLVNNTTGTNNSAVGHYSMRDNTSGGFNAAFGNVALINNTTGQSNTALGANAMVLNDSGSFNSAVGVASLNNNVSGQFNTSCGGIALSQNSTGNYNSAIGYATLNNNTTGSSNTAIGAGANVASGALTNATAIGANALVSISNALVLGNNANIGIGTGSPSQKLHVVGNGLFTGTVTASCGVLACSDRRYKQDIKPLTHCLEKICSMTGVNYHWKKNDFPEMHFNDDLQMGVIAQEVETVFPEIVNTNTEGYKTVDYSKFAPALIEAVKELNVKLEIVLEENKRLKTENEKIKNYVGMDAKAEK